VGSSINALGNVPRIAAQWQQWHWAAFSEADVDHEGVHPHECQSGSWTADFIPGAINMVETLRTRASENRIHHGDTNCATADVLVPIAAKRGYAPDNLVAKG
jgi:phosphonoacetaldehyde hydrolase